MLSTLSSISNSPHVTPLILSTISGLSTGLGGLIVVLFGKPSRFMVGFLLALASGVMMYVSFMDLLPETIELIGFTWSIVFFLLGMLLFHILIMYLPEPDPAILQSNKAIDSKLFVTSIIVVIGISLHNFPEGMAVYLSAMNGWKLGLSIAIAIGLHNIPEGIAVAVSMYAATHSKMKAIQWSLISGLCEPLGAAIFGFIFYGWISTWVVYAQLAGVAGIMTYICLKELIPNALESMDSKWWCLLGNLLGSAILFVCSRALEQFED